MRATVNIIIVITLACVSAAAQASPFLEAVKKRVLREPADVGAQRASFDSLCSIEKDPLARRVFNEYGSIFVSDTSVRLPSSCIFANRDEVALFQSRLNIKGTYFGPVLIELQSAALDELEKARFEIARAGLRITPLDGSIAGRRNYDETVRLWNSRFYRALDHWTRKGKITVSEARDAQNSPIYRQVEMVAAWESKGYYFSTDLSKSIFYSVAPPGTSQHLSLLAFDVVEAGNPAVRKILNKYGWFQTIRTDQPHFTFLGVAESELPRLGLKNIVIRGNSYWIPDTDVRPVVAIN